MPWRSGPAEGGGASYIARRFQPRSFVGLELSRTAVDFCRGYHLLPGLSFRQGDAEALPFADGSFDILLNVESSLYYPNVPRFLAKAARVLRAGGHFIYADMRYLEEVPEWKEQLKGSGLRLMREEDLTANVAKALSLDLERKLKLIDRYVPGILQPFFKNFTGLNDPSLARGKPRTGERVYLSFQLQK